MEVRFSQVAVAALVAFIEGGVAFCVESPVGSPTTPATATQSGLLPSTRGRYSNAGNDVVTGNVGGGREFRGFVPYGSSAYFQGNQGVGTTSVENFIRRTTGSSYAYDRSPGAVEPYYSPYRSVSSLSSRTYGSYGIGSSSALQLPQMSPLKQPLNYGLVPLEEARKLVQQNEQQNIAIEPQTGETTQEQLVPSGYRPLSSTPLEMEQYITQQIQGKLYPTEQQAQAEQPSSLQNAPQIAQPKESVTEITVKPDEPVEPTQSVEPVQPGQLPKRPRNEIAKAPGIFEEMKKEVHDEFVKNLKDRAAAKVGEEQAEANQPSEPNAPRTAPKAVLGYSRTFATQATDRFNELMRASEQYMQQKEYYKAADAYTIAAVYQRNNPLPYAGKAFALLGAGEYMSSAYFLTRAINVFPDYARFKVDLGTMFGDKDMLEKRVSDISAWQERTGSPELQFLLAYIYLQTDRLELAQRMTNGALVKMPQSRALQTLDEVVRLNIEDAKKTGKP